MRRNRTAEWLKAHPIEHPKEFSIEDPFKIMNVTELTDIQQMVQRYAKLFKYMLTFAFSASCGAGKTLAGIYLIHRFGVKTLIVSSRTAINDQWEYILKKLYPKLRIRSIHHKCDNPHVYIYSPQYLIQDLSRIPEDVKFIIYDEIHSIVSDSFGKCVEEPLKRIRKYPANSEERMRHMPYMLALSGTYPKDSSIIKNIFADHISTVSKITDIPVYVYDYHIEVARRMLKNDRRFMNVVKGNVHNTADDESEMISGDIKSFSELPEGVMIKLDVRYEPPDDYQYIDHIIDNNVLQQHDVKICPEFRGFVITEIIDSSVYAAIRLAERFKCNVLLMRALDEPSYVIKPTGMKEFDRMELIQDYLNGHYEKIDMKKNDLQVVLKDRNISIICGCYHRLKEGISVENAVWGVCTKFIYSDISRAQILGRVRRTSSDPLIHNHRRIFLVNSGKITTNEYQLMMLARRFHQKMDRSKIKTTYDFRYEQEVFDRENYRYEVL